MNNDQRVDCVLRIREADKEMMRLRDNALNTLISISSGALVFSAGLVRLFPGGIALKGVLLCSWAFLLLSILMAIMCKYHAIELLHRYGEVLVEQIFENKFKSSVITPTTMQKVIRLALYVSFFFGLAGLSVFTALNI